MLDTVGTSTRAQVFLLFLLQSCELNCSSFRGLCCKLRGCIRCFPTRSEERFSIRARRSFYFQEKTSEIYCALQQWTCSLQKGWNSARENFVLVAWEDETKRRNQPITSINIINGKFLQLQEFFYFISQGRNNRFRSAPRRLWVQQVNSARTIGGEIGSLGTCCYLFIRYNVFAFCLLLQYILDSEWNGPGDGKWKRIFTSSSTKAIDAHKMLFGEAKGTTKSQFVWHGISLLMMWALAFYSYASRWWLRWKLSWGNLTFKEFLRISID